VNVPVAIGVLSLAPIVIHESKDEAAPHTLDLTGAATATLGLGFLIYAVSEAPKNGAWGFAMSGAGLVLVAWLMPHKDALVALLFGMAVAEAGFVTASVPLTIAATDGVGDDERGLASGVLSTATELGNALGRAAVAAVIAAATAASGSALLGGLRWGLWSATACAALALVLVVVCMRPGPRETKGSSTDRTERQM
jgi:MFS family permease